MEKSRATHRDSGGAFRPGRVREALSEPGMEKSRATRRGSGGEQSASAPRHSADFSASTMLIRSRLRFVIWLMTNVNTTAMAAEMQ